VGTSTVRAVNLFSGGNLAEATLFEAERDTALLGSSDNFTVYAKELYKLLLAIRITDRDPEGGYYDYKYN